MENSTLFETFITKAGSIPGVKVDRTQYLTKEFGRKHNDILPLIIEKGPLEAGISKNELSKIADSSIENETMITTAISTATGIPGGLLMGVTIPGDIMQFYTHVLIIVQKLMYLYGWDEDIFDSNGNIDDDTMNVIILYVGTMFGVKAASSALVKIAANSTAKFAKGLVKKSMIKAGFINSAKFFINICKAIGIKTTFRLGSKVATKAIPVISAVFSGVITYASFKPMCKKLKKYLESGIIDNIENEDDVDVILESESIS